MDQYSTLFVCTWPADGYYIDNGVALICSTCQPGTYQTAACTTSSDTRCEPCTAIPYAGAGSTITCTSAGDTRLSGCVPGYAVQTGADGEMDTCVACVPDTFKDDHGAGPCASCTAHSTTSGVTGHDAADDCQCLPGYYYISWLRQCRACDADTYKNVIANADCASCPANADTDGQTGRTSLHQCVCGPGYSYSLTSENGTVVSSCLACAIGRYKDARANQDCTTCPANSNTGTANGSTTRAACLCSPGFTGSLAVGGSFCSSCPAATYKDTSGEAGCTSCPQNSNTDGSGVPSSISACYCDTGYSGELTETTSVCTACSTGQYYDVTTQQCDDCDAGTYQNLATQM